MSEEQAEYAQLHTSLEEGRKAAEGMRQFLRRLELAEDTMRQARDAVSLLSTLEERIGVQQALFDELHSLCETEEHTRQRLLEQQEQIQVDIHRERAARLAAMETEIQEGLGWQRESLERDVAVLRVEMEVLQAGIEVLRKEHADLDALVKKHRAALKRIAEAAEVLQEG